MCKNYFFLSKISIVSQYYTISLQFKLFSYEVRVMYNSCDIRLFRDDMYVRVRIRLQMKKKNVTIGGHEKVKSMRTTRPATYWECRVIYHGLSHGAPDVAREPTVQLWALMSSAVPAIRLHFARHTATSPVLFHEKNVRDGKLRKDKGSCPMKLPFVRGTSSQRRDGSPNFGGVKKYFSKRKKEKEN